MESFMYYGKILQIYSSVSDAGAFLIWDTLRK